MYQDKYSKCYNNIDFPRMVTDMYQTVTLYIF